MVPAVSRRTVRLYPRIFYRHAVPNALLLHRSLRLFSPRLWAVRRHVADFATVEALERFALSLGSRVGRGSGASGGSRFRCTFNVSPLGMQSRGAVSGMLVLRNKRRRALAG